MRDVPDPRKDNEWVKRYWENLFPKPTLVDKLFHPLSIFLYGILLVLAGVALLFAGMMP